MLEQPDGIDTELQQSLGLCERLMTMLEEELRYVDATLANRTRDNEIVERLQTIPGIGPVASQVLYATIGEIERCPNARKLASYAGLVPTVRQSGSSDRHGGITKEGSKYLRSVLVQGAHVVASRSSSDELAPLRGGIRALPRNARPPEDRRRGVGSAPAAHRVPRVARQHGLRPLASEVHRHLRG